MLWNIWNISIFPLSNLYNNIGIGHMEESRNAILPFRCYKMLNIEIEFSVDNKYIS